MTNVLLNVYEFDAPWAYEHLKDVLRPEHRVTILTMSHGSEIPDGDTWLRLYEKGAKIYNVLTGAFHAYGISADQVSFVSWFHDTPESAQKKLREADVVFMTGGLPDLFYERMDAMGLVELLKVFPGVVMGCSAGAMVQMAEYHITPDEDYDSYDYYKGLGLLDGFEPEVHYCASQVQQESIQRYQKERGKTVYATTNSGGLLVQGGKITCMGDVTVFPEPVR
jgi:peptidase E